MDRYKTGRMIAKTVSGVGWLAVAICLLLFSFSLLRAQLEMWTMVLPLLGLLGSALVMIMLSWLARAVFDMASAQAEGRN